MKLEQFDTIPRIGWATLATPITELPQIAQQFGATWMGCKRDDLCSGLLGGSKVRKLDFLLADSHFQNSSSWASIGAIGSGHLVACAAAAHTLQRKFQAHCFFEPTSEEILKNLAFIAEHTEKIHFYRSRMEVLLTRPAVFFRKTVQNCSFIPPGGSSALGIVGMVRAGVELAAQIQAGMIPVPDRIYVAAGTCGTVAGLAVGLAVAGFQIPIKAVATVEKIIVSTWRINFLINQVCKLLLSFGFQEVKKIKNIPIVIDYKQLGKGYAYPTEAANMAVKIFDSAEISLEPVYTGKMAAAILHDLKNGFNGKVLFWNSHRRNLPPTKSDWKNKLPVRLQKLLVLPLK